MQGVRLEDLPVVHQSPHLQGRRRQLLAADDAIGRLRRGQVVAHRADAAQPLHEDRHLPEGPPLNEPLETSKLHDVEAGLDDLVRLVEENRDLSVPFDAGHRLDHDLVAGGKRYVHDDPPGSNRQSYLISSYGRSMLALRSKAVSAAQIVSADGGQPGR